MTLDDYRNERLRKLAEIKNLGIDPYPAKSFRDTKIADIINNFAKLEGKTVTIAGRLTAIRSFGKLAFLRLRDMSGEVQIFMQANASGETYPFERREDLAKAARSGPRKSLRPQASIGLKLLKLLDTGDFIEATGTVGKSTTGEISVFAPAVRLLGKSLRPLPGRDGFTNKEERFRRRYVDMNVTPRYASV